MIWLNLFTAILISGYAQWLFYRGWRYTRDLSRAANAEEVLENVMEQRRFFLIQGTGSLVALVLFLGVKSLLLLFQTPEPSAFTTFVFGDFPHPYLIGKLGCLGVVLVAASISCFYLWLKSKHYIDVLYALREALGLAPTRNIPSAPALPHSVAPRQVV
jgi:hypothetical protein